MSPRSIPMLLFSCLALTALSAQEPAADPSQLPGLPPAQEGDLLCRCVSTFLPDGNETFFFKMDEDYHEVALVGEGISPPFPVRGSTTFTLYRKSTAGADQPPYVPAVRQELEGSGKDFIIILSRKDGNSPIRSKAINISKANCPANNIHLYNESPVALSLRINEAEGTVQSRKNFRYDFSGSSRDTYTSAKIVMRYKEEERIMASRRLRLVPGRRMILICFPSKARAALGATPLRMVTYQDKP